MKVAVIFLIVGIVGLGSSKVINEEIHASEICFEHYGCFDTKSPWTSLKRPIGALPKQPWEVGTRFILFTRGTQETEQIGFELLPDKDAILKFSDFNAERKTYLLIHGFTDTHKVDWLWKTKDLLLQNENVNIIAVDWLNGARPPYLQAAANSRIVGAQIARMITYLEQKANLNAQDVHVISHSLGAHVAGYAGAKLLGRIARITAIDPMSLYFSGTDEMVRLDTTDAQFVEVIHSNSDILTNMGLGISEAIGHVDLYPNGGSKQPGCQDTLGSLITEILKLLFLDFEGAISTRACSHARAAHFYAESISNAESCPFVSFPCNNYGDFEKGNCYQDCSETGKCTSLGYNSKKRDMSANGVYYLRTTDGGDKNNNTYCKQVAQVQIPVSLSQQKTKGSLTLKFVAEDGSSSETFNVAKSVNISPGQILQLWVEIPANILRSPEDKPKISLRYTRGLLQAKSLEVDNVYVKVIKPDMTTLTSVYYGALLNTGIDTVVY